MKGKIKWICLFFFVMSTAVISYQQHWPSTAIEKKLLSYLISVDDLPIGKIFDAVYILGGNQENLRPKYKTLASLYLQECCKYISILSRPGTTYFSRSLGRNLTNDEWSLMTLEGLGVSQKDIQTLEVEPGFFGTYSEARYVSTIARQREWKSLLLITSPHHTKRVRKSFDYFMDGSIVEVSVTASKSQASIFEILAELFKLKFYQYFLLT